MLTNANSRERALIPRSAARGMVSRPMAARRRSARRARAKVLVLSEVIAPHVHHCAPGRDFCWRAAEAGVSACALAIVLGIA